MKKYLRSMLLPLVLVAVLLLLSGCDLPFWGVGRAAPATAAGGCEVPLGTACECDRSGAVGATAGALAARGCPGTAEWGGAREAGGAMGEARLAPPACGSARSAPSLAQLPAALHNPRASRCPAMVG